MFIASHLIHITLYPPQGFYRLDQLHTNQTKHDLHVVLLFTVVNILFSRGISTKSPGNSAVAGTHDPPKSPPQ